MANVIQSVGDFTAIFNSPLTLFGGTGLAGGGVGIPLQGFRLDDVFINTAQMLDNAKRVALVDGGTIALTNKIKAGQITINAAHMSNLYQDGDLPLICTMLQGAADSLGALLTISYGFNGMTCTVTFYSVIFVSCPPLILAGNDVPTYPCVFSYATYTTAIG
jgi:hypothetical protein